MSQLGALLGGQLSNSFDTYQQLALRQAIEAQQLDAMRRCAQQYIGTPQGDDHVLLLLDDAQDE